MKELLQTFIYQLYSITILIELLFTFVESQIAFFPLTIGGKNLFQISKTNISLLFYTDIACQGKTDIRHRTLRTFSLVRYSREECLHSLLEIMRQAWTNQDLILTLLQSKLDWIVKFSMANCCNFTLISVVEIFKK